MLAVYFLLCLTKRATGQTKAQQTLVTIFGCDPIIREMSCKINHHGYVFKNLSLWRLIIRDVLQMTHAAVLIIREMSYHTIYVMNISFMSFIPILLWAMVHLWEVADPVDPHESNHLPECDPDHCKPCPVSVHQVQHVPWEWKRWAQKERRVAHRHWSKKLGSREHTGQRRRHRAKKIK